MKVIVLTINPYKEKDAIINAISEEGFITFSARGILNPTSKNAGLNNILTVADVTFSPTKSKYNILKESEILLTPYKVKEEYDYLTSLMLLDEVTNSLLQDEEKHKVFNHLIEAIEMLKEGKENPLLIDLIYLARILKIAGYEFEVNKCLYCQGSKSIVAFNFSEGGFICKNCFDQEHSNDLESVDQMLLMRFICNFNRENSKADSLKFKESDLKFLLNKFYEFIVDGIGTKIKSISLLNN